MQRNIDIDRIAVLVLCLAKLDATVADVLPAKARGMLAW
jgi:hypothetical protein